MSTKIRSTKSLFVCDVAENGKRALDMVKENSYDLVLMDLQMPEIDGYEATREIRKVEGDRFKTIPIIALTASAMIDKKDTAYEAGMTDYMSKTFSPQELYRKIYAATGQPVNV